MTFAQARIALVLFSFILVVPLVIHAQPTLETTLADMEEEEGKLEAVSFDFTQIVDFKGAGLKENSQGKASFKKPNRMKVVKTSPRAQQMISNGQKMWVYNPEFNQVWVGGVKDWATSSNFPKGLLPINNYVADLKKYFDLSVREGEKNQDGVLVLVGVPKDPALGYHLTLFISTTTWLPVETRYQSETAEVVTKLTNINTEPSLQNSEFNFTPPRGTDIIPFN